jgi:VanZ family protein
MKKSVFWGSLAVILCIIIFLFTASPSSTGAHTQSVIEKITGMKASQAHTLNFIIRKMTHLSIFGLLAVCLTLAFTKKPYYNAWILTTMYAATDEYHQSFMPGRTSSYYDVLLDSCGAIVAILIVRLVRAKRNKTK